MRLNLSSLTSGLETPGLRSLLASGPARLGQRALPVCALLLVTSCSAKMLGTGADGGDSLSPGDGDGDGPYQDCTEDPGDGDEGDAPGCEDYTVKFDNAVANVLVVLDRSGSMRDLSANRWDPSVAAIEKLTASLPETLRVGLMTFPGDCSAYKTASEQQDCLLRQSGSVLGQYTCEPGQVRVMPGEGTAPTISQQLHTMGPAGATPTASSLRNAHEALKAMATGTSTQTVLLVTDGAPNCASGDSGGLGSVGIGLGTASTGQPQAIPQTVDRIKAMAKDDIKTYVLGYDTKKDAALRDTLNEMAQAGGTGDAEHHAVGDEASLLKALESLASRTASCELALNSTVVDPWKVQVTLDGTVLTVDDVNGYALDAAGDNLTLLGTACEAARAGTGHSLRVKAVCPPPPPPPPAPPPAPPGDGDVAGDGDDDEDLEILDDDEVLDIKRGARKCVPRNPPELDAGGPIDLF
jgi:hypothetical protein